MGLQSQQETQQYAACQPEQQAPQTLAHQQSQIMHWHMILLIEVWKFIINVDNI